MTTTATRILISCDEESQGFAHAELQTMFPALPSIAWLEGDPGEPTGTGIVEVPVSFAEFAGAVERFGSIFIRHQFPVLIEVPLQGDASDLPRLQEATPALALYLERDRTFSVQTRFLGEFFRPVSRTELNAALYEALAAQTGATLDTRAPEQVVSVVGARGAAYLGVSWTSENRSAWPGGQHRFKREEGQISRAEFKLLEALAVFALVLPEQGTALDIGAAPGGWTRVLRQHGLNVVAVDPADLHESLRRDRGVTHIRERIQKYRPAHPFDVIVNDLKMDAPASVEIMRIMRPYLAPDGLAVVTLKLPKAVRSARILTEFLDKDIRDLERSYQVIGVRQLFHNRSEVTAALRAK